MARVTLKTVLYHAEQWGVQVQEIGHRRWEVSHPNVQGMTGEVDNVQDLWSEVYDFARMAGKVEE